MRRQLQDVRHHASRFEAAHGWPKLTTWVGPKGLELARLLTTADD
jgi:hypothetical protein